MGSAIDFVLLYFRNLACNKNFTTYITVASKALIDEL